MNIIKIFSALLIMLLSATIVLANTIETVTTSATAETEDKAISKALAQAIQQVNGVQVNVVTHLQETGTQLIVNWLGNTTVLEGQEINRGYTNIQTAGPIKSYKVLSSQFLQAQKLWQCTIESNIVKYTNIGVDRSNLVQLSVTPFRASKESFETIDGNKSAKLISAKLNQLLTENFVQSQRFRILDRDFWHESNNELLITATLGQATQESVKQGQKLGADYILVGLINKFSVQEISEKSYGSVSSTYKAEFDISLRVIEVATSDILWSYTFKKIFDKNALRNQLKILRPDPSVKTELEAALEMQDGLYELISNDISKKVLAHFYPIKVLSVTNGIHLSQGGKQIQVGEHYNIYSNPKTLTDPDTGTKIQTRGKKVAIVKIAAVFDSYATAELIDGSLQHIKEGNIAILKESTNSKTSAPQKEARPLTPGSSEKPISWQ